MFTCFESSLDKEVEVFQNVLSKFSDDLSKINSSEVSNCISILSHSLPPSPSLPLSLPPPLPQHSVILQSVKDLVVLFLSSCEPSVDSVGGEEVPRERIWAELKETILKTDAQLREEETNNETKWEERGRGRYYDILFRRIIQIILHFHLYDYFNEDTSFTKTVSSY